MAELIVQIIEVAEGPAEEEVLADVAERPFDLALGLGPIGPAGARLEAVMAGEIDKRAIVDDEPIRVLADVASRAAIWQRRTLCRSWWTTKRPQIGLL